MKTLKEFDEWLLRMQEANQKVSDESTLESIKRYHQGRADSFCNAHYQLMEITEKYDVILMRKLSNH